jgi:insertion element IS1 protein InsB
VDTKVFKNTQAKIKRSKHPRRRQRYSIIGAGRIVQLLQKKLNKIYVWLAVDRVRGEVVDFEVTTSREFSAYLPMAFRLEERCNIEISASDYYAVYGQYKIAEKHIMTKVETSLVESKNSLIRHYLARFNRKTKRYSKAIDMIENSILMLFNKNILLSIIG